MLEVSDYGDSSLCNDLGRKLLDGDQELWVGRSIRRSGYFLDKE